MCYLRAPHRKRTFFRSRSLLNEEHSLKKLCTNYFGVQCYKLDVRVFSSFQDLFRAGELSHIVINTFRKVFWCFDN